MSAEAGPNVVSDGLVFAYDVANGKSYKGAPTTNEIGNQDFTTGWAFSNVTMTSGIDDPFGEVEAYRMTVNGGTASYIAHCRFGYNQSPFLSAPIWSSSVYVRAGLYNSVRLGRSSASNAFGSMTCNLTDGTYTTHPTPADAYSMEYVGNGWYHISFSWETSAYDYVCFTLAITDYASTSDGGWSSAHTAGDYVDIAFPQWELKPRPTPFVDGTRSPTESIYDLTGNNAITATSITAAANNTFVFVRADANRLELDNTLTSYIGTGDVDYAIEAWTHVFTNPTGVGVAAYQIAGSNDSYGIGLQVEPGPTFNFGYRSNSNFDSGIFNLNEWTHVVGTRTAGIPKIYINGNLSTTNSNLVVTAPTTNFMIGGGGSRIGDFDGEIAIVRVYNRGLSDAEIEQNFRAMRSRFGI